MDNPCLIFCITNNKNSENGGNNSHKDILGAAMGLKIKREYIGDIIIDNNSAFIICHKNIADIIIEELHGIKRSTVSFEYYDEPLKYIREYSEIRTATVASLRADSVVAALLNKSRTEAVKHIKQGNVKINHILHFIIC